MSSSVALPAQAPFAPSTTASTYTVSVRDSREFTAKRGDSRPALHAFGHRPRRPDGPKHGGASTRPGLRDRDRAADQLAARCACEAAPTAMTRGAVAWRKSRPSAATRTRFREPPPAALGTVADLRRPVLPRARLVRDRAGAGVLRCREPVRSRTAAGLRCRRTGGGPCATLSRPSRPGRGRKPAPRRTGRGAEELAFPRRCVPRRAARPGRRGLQRPPTGAACWPRRPRASARP